MKVRRIARNFLFLIIGLWLSAPFVVVTGVSLNKRRLLFFPPEGFSLLWYERLFTDADWLRAIKHSLSIALTADILSCSIALPVAYAFWRYRFFYARALFALGLTPFMLPPVITALGYLVFWTQFGMYGTFTAVTVSHAIFLVTLPLMTLSLGFESIDSSIVEAARTMGAGEWTVFRTIVMPILQPYLMSGFIFAFVISLNEYIIAYMVAGFTVKTVPIEVFNAMRYGYSPVMACIAVIFALISFVSFLVVSRFSDLTRLLGAWRR